MVATPVVKLTAWSRAEKVICLRRVGAYERPTSETACYACDLPSVMLDGLCRLVMWGACMLGIRTLPVAWPFRGTNGAPLADAYLDFPGGMCRPNTIRTAGNGA